MNIYIVLYILDWLDKIALAYLSSLGKQNRFIRPTTDSTLFSINPRGHFNYN
jgi:hypothetical protein